MQTILKTAFRNIFRQKKRTMLLVSAIAFGMLMVTLVNGFTGGMAINVRDNFSNALGGHIFITGQEYTDAEQVISRMIDDPQLSSLLQMYSDETVSLTQRSQSFATVIFGSRQGMQTIYGVDYGAETQIYDSVVVLEGSLDQAAANARSIVLPQQLTQRIGVVVGESVLVRMDTVTGQQNVGEFVLTAVIEDQAELGMSAAYAHLEYLNELLNLPVGSFQTLNLFLSDLAIVDDTADAFRAVLPMRPEPEETSSDAEVEMGMGMMFGGPRRTEVEPWEGTRYSISTIHEIMEPVEAVVNLLDSLALGVFAILLLIIMIGITNTFRMIVLERTKEIGTLRALGMQQPMVKRIFLAEAFFLGLLGAGFGLVLAAAAMAILAVIPITEPGLQFFLRSGHFSFIVSPGGVALYFAIIVSICLVAAYWPAQGAARLSPIKAIGSHL